MRLSVFIPENSAQLVTDLQKLYQGYLEDQSLTNDALATRINDERKLFFVTLFNARHLGAVQVETDDNCARLSDLCVREITRRRGVGKNLLREVEKDLLTRGIKKVTMSLTTIREDERANTTLFMLACGYQLVENNFIKSL